MFFKFYLGFYPHSMRNGLLRITFAKILFSKLLCKHLANKFIIHVPHFKKVLEFSPLNVLMKANNDKYLIWSRDTV